MTRSLLPPPTAFLLITFVVSMERWSFKGITAKGTPSKG